MSADFLDTNVLVYFAEPGAEKSARAAELVSSGGVVSVQVLTEFAAVCRRKFRVGWPELGESLALIRSLLDVRPLTVNVHIDGLRLAARHGFHVYDAMIVSAALDAGCSTLWSEDMQDGLVVEGRLRIRNPFA